MTIFATPGRPLPAMDARALWDHIPTPTSLIPTISDCTPFVLPSNGAIGFGGSDYMTLTSDVIFNPSCTQAPDPTTLTETFTTMTNTDSGRDPFYASTLPVIYVLAATTVTAYILVILLFITPKTFVTGGTVVLGRRGFAAGGSGAEAGIGIGGRPWLQKIAALSVAISLSIATANTFNIAEEQYDVGIMDAKALQDQVLGGQELKIIMVISDTFLWLAQAQTLIRLFPRHREKIIIKWTALALISLCLLFSILNDFVYAGSTRPAAFVDAIPALSYLFQLALGLLYCAWVMYYALTKKQYAFYHPKMRNMCLLALISIFSVLVPVVFFVVDISMPDVAGWGDYVRWVGAAAASVVVWEWVERIEALERNEKKDGVLGREVFDGDEMLEVTPSTIVSTKKGDPGDKDGGGGGKTSGSGGLWPTMAGAAGRYRPRAQDARRSTDNSRPPRGNATSSVPLPLPPWPARPQPVATPVSRTDSGSAESTVYAVRYHPIGDASSAIPEDAAAPPSRAAFDIEAQHHHDDEASSRADAEKESAAASTATTTTATSPDAPRPPPPGPAARLWHALNPFSTTRRRPPPEISAHHSLRRRLSLLSGHGAHARETTATTTSTTTATTAPPAARWGLLAKLEDFAAARAEQLRGAAAKAEEDDTAALRVTRIPAPPRRRTVMEVQRDVDAEDEGPGTRQRKPQRPGENRPPSSLSFAAPPGPRREEEARGGGLAVLRIPAPPPIRAEGGGGVG